ncbi:hypothetical protein IV203_030779 [Nitzschia inconspicua]|uniref:Uncharacterized protein n=1 Tax=Nitzschia inconspicua TaxID=303405 RepID=A0A9K3Q206_9STRA|nr:hypothetical protein IV203_030779 [Nitzschia inconspicua]
MFGVLYDHRLVCFKPVFKVSDIGLYAEVSSLHCGVKIMSLGVEEALGLEVVEGSNVPVNLFEPSLGLVIIDFSMPGFISDFPFLVAVFPHEADDATGPRATMVLVLDLDDVVLEFLQLEGWSHPIVV